VNLLHSRHGWMLRGARRGDHHLMTCLKQQRNGYRPEVMSATDEGDPHVLSLITAGSRPSRRLRSPHRGSGITTWWGNGSFSFWGNRQSPIMTRCFGRAPSVNFAEASSSLPTQRQAARDNDEPGERPRRSQRDSRSSETNLARANKPTPEPWAGVAVAVWR
jgi:hypothetical protein